MKERRVRKYHYTIWLKCNKLRGVLRSLMETCSYLYSLENHFSHVSTYILQLWPDTCFLYISFSFCRIHALRLLLCRIPLFHSSSTQYSAYPALTETLPSYLSLPAVACMILHIHLLSVMAGYMPLVSSHAGYLFSALALSSFPRFRHWRIQFPCIYLLPSFPVFSRPWLTVFPSWPDIFPTYPAMPDTCLSGLLSATFHVSGIDGYLSSVSSHAGYNPFVHISSRVFPSLSSFPSWPDTSHAGYLLFVSSPGASLHRDWLFNKASCQALGLQPNSLTGTAVSNS